MAMCVMAVVAVAPCQCFSPGGIQITSPGRISSIVPPHAARGRRPPSRLGLAQRMRVPGGPSAGLKRDTGTGHACWIGGREKRVYTYCAVNHSAGPLPEGREPLLLMSMWPIVAGPCAPE